MAEEKIDHNKKFISKFNIYLHEQLKDNNPYVIYLFDVNAKKKKKEKEIEKHDEDFDKINNENSTEEDYNSYKLYRDNLIYELNNLMNEYKRMFKELEKKFIEDTNYVAGEKHGGVRHQFQKAPRRTF